MHAVPEAIMHAAPDMNTIPEPNKQPSAFL